LDLAEDLTVGPPGLFPKGDVRDKDACPDDILDLAAELFDRVAYDLESILGLFVHVAGSDHLTVWT
jgi:hypothetical protein